MIQGVVCMECPITKRREVWGFSRRAARYAWMDEHHAATGHMWASMQPLFA